MRTYLRNLFTSFWAGLALGLMVAGALTPVAVYALVVPPSYPPRMFQSQQTHYIRLTMPYNACTYAPLTCIYRAGAIPYNSYIKSVYFQVLATFVGATTMVASVGTTTAAPTNIVNVQDILTAGNGAAGTIVATSVGEAVTGNGVAQTGSNGGIDLYVTLTATVAIPTAGLAVMIIEYYPPNDGLCTPVPMGSTPVGC